MKFLVYNKNVKNREELKKVFVLKFLFNISIVFFY